MIDRLSEDHANARLLANGVNRIPGLNVKSAQSNIVFIDIDPTLPIKSGDLQKQLTRNHIKIWAFSTKRLLYVTHWYVERAEIE